MSEYASAEKIREDELDTGRHSLEPSGRANMLYTFGLPGAVHSTLERFFEIGDKNWVSKRPEGNKARPFG